MKLQNLKVTVASVSEETIELVTELGQTISLPRHFMPTAMVGEGLFVSIDAKPLVSSDQHAKDILNEMIKE